MCDPVTVGITMGGLGALGAFMNAEANRAAARQQSEMHRYESQVAEQNAQSMQQQANLERQRGEAEQERINRERDTLRHQYEQEAGRNRSLLAAGNVDISSGSALDVLAGNATLFSGDMAVNRYNHALADWEARERARQAEFQSAQYTTQAEASRRNAGWVKKSAGGLGTSLLTAGMSGAGAGLSGYRTAGGTFK